MAGKTKAAGTTALTPTLRLTPVKIVESEAQTVNVAVPTEFEHAERVNTLFPTAQFGEDSKPGEYITGFYRGYKEGVGENNSRLYMLDIGGNRLVGVWGSSILDNKMDIAAPKEGDKVLIQFIGTVPTKRKLNNAKDFEVRIIRV